LSFSAERCGTHREREENHFWNGVCAFTDWIALPSRELLARDRRG
jgi:hypothetical protein